MTYSYQAYADKEVIIEPLAEGRLSNLTFAVKDVFHLEGRKNAAGNPDWLRSHEPAEENAPIITHLLEEGAKLTGTTITDELMYSLQGENYHYGTPVNPRDPARIPGGSSSGSAVAVAAGLTDFSIGTDTGGSVRIPSAYCGLYGIRPTHGKVSIENVIPLAPSFDTVGWMAKDAETLTKVGASLLNSSEAGSSFSRIFVSKDAWALADSDTQKALASSISFLEKKLVETSWIEVAKEGLPAWANAFRILQGKEIWEVHGEWIEAEKPVFGPGIKERFQMASRLTEAETVPQKELRTKVRRQLVDLLKEDGLLVIPTVPGIAPKLNLPDGAVEERRKRTLQLSCIAGLAGLPQVTIPIGLENGAPIGLSFIAGPDQDMSLLQWISDFK